MPIMLTNCAEIDLDALEFNTRRTQQYTGSARLLAVVKTNAYGHGAIPTVRWLREFGVGFFCVVSINEALEIAKGYEPAEVVSFVNGILGTFARTELAEVTGP